MNQSTIRSGSTWQRKVDVWTDNTKSSRIDLSDSTVTAQVFDRPGGAKIWDAHVDTDNASDGSVLISLSKAQTQARSQSVVYWVVQADLADGRSATIDEGKLVIK